MGRLHRKQRATMAMRPTHFPAPTGPLHSSETSNITFVSACVTAVRVEVSAIDKDSWCGLVGYASPVHHTHTALSMHTSKQAVM
jgi:hypothetical protein